MPPLEASWADSQRARHPIGPWSFVAGSNCRPMVYDTIALPTELTKHGRMFYTGYHPAIRVANPFFQYRPIATSVDSVLYYLQCFSPAFATTNKTFGYLQVQYLFAYSIRECPLAIRTADHMWTMLALFSVARTVTTTCSDTIASRYPLN